MRIYYLPISTRRALIYCEPLAHLQPVKKQSYIDRVVGRANKTWADWEKDPKSTWDWKRKVTGWGNMAFKKIPFEEWSLKSIPPLKLAERRRWWEAGEERESLSDEASSALLRRSKKVELRLPAAYQGLCVRGVFENLQKLVDERGALHRKRLFWSIIGMPLTIPFAALPIVPNIPFFYVAFRAYSHWRAVLGMNHLQHLLKNDMLRPTPSPVLDSLYTLGLVYPSRAESRNAPDASAQETQLIVERIRQQAHDGKEEMLLLFGWNGKLIAERLGLPSLEIEIERAVEQVLKQMDKDGAKKEQSEAESEKKELEELRTSVMANSPSLAEKAQTSPPKAAKAG